LLLLDREKLAELRQTLELRREGHTDEAIARVQTGHGKEAMDRARAVIAQMAVQEAAILQERQTSALNSDRALQYGIVAAIIVLMALGGSRIRRYVGSSTA
jgi:CHASE3 domain sensor protein